MDRPRRSAFLEGSSDDDVTNGNITDPETLPDFETPPAANLVDSDSSLTMSVRRPTETSTSAAPT